MFDGSEHRGPRQASRSVYTLPPTKRQPRAGFDEIVRLLVREERTEVANRCPWPGCDDSVHQRERAGVQILNLGEFLGIGVVFDTWTIQLSPDTKRPSMQYYLCASSVPSLVSHAAGSSLLVLSQREIHWPFEKPSWIGRGGEPWWLSVWLTTAIGRTNHWQSYVLHYGTYVQKFCSTMHRRCH